MVDYDGIYLVDSLSATVGERLLLLEAVKLRDQGCSAAEIAAALEALKKRICIWASLDTLEYLYKGGRLSRTAAGIGSLANMKPIITVSPEGSVSVLKKCIGQKRSMDQILQLTESKRPDPAYPFFGLYTYDRSNCEALLSRMAEQGASWPVADLLNIGPSIGAHVGTGAYGVAYIAAETPKKPVLPHGFLWFYNKRAPRLGKPRGSRLYRTSVFRFIRRPEGSPPLRYWQIYRCMPMII